MNRNDDFEDDFMRRWQDRENDPKWKRFLEIQESKHQKALEKIRLQHIAKVAHVQVQNEINSPRLLLRHRN